MFSKAAASRLPELIPTDAFSKVTTPTLGGLKVLCVSRYLALAGVSGHNTYLREVVAGLGDAGFSVTYLWLDGPLFHRPWWKIPAHAVPCARLVCWRGLRIGSWVFTTECSLWIAGISLVAANKCLNFLPWLLPRQLRQLKTWAENKFQDHRQPLASNVSAPAKLEVTRFRNLLCATKPDAVLLNYAYLAPLAPVARELGVRTAVLTHDVVHQLHATMRSRGLAGATMDLGAEAKLLQQADLAVAIQNEEAAELRRMITPEKVVTVPMPQQLVAGNAGQEPATLLFVGSGTGPNLDGLQWFVGEVWPAIRAARPEARLRVCGSVCGSLEEVPAGVELAGVVPDLAPEYSRATVVIAPLLCGSGLKIKVVEAWGHGRAVVGTPIAMQGLGEYAGNCGLVAAGPAEFAAAVLGVLKNSAQRQQLETQAKIVVKERFSHAAALAPLTGWLFAGCGN